MGKNFINSITQNPFKDVKEFNVTKKINKSFLSQVYKFSASINGESGKKNVSFTAGYIGYDYDNTFFLDEAEINILIELLTSAKKELVKDKNVVNEKDKLYHILHSYVKKGYVDHIDCTITNKDTPKGYNELFKVVHIQPHFISELPEDDINLKFNFEDILAIQPNQNHLDKLADSIRGSKDSNIKVNWLNYNMKKERDKIIAKAKKDYESNINYGDSRNVTEQQKIDYINYANKNWI